MKLSDIAEGTFGDLVSMASAKIGSRSEDRLIVKTDQRLFDLVQKARGYQFHLFDRRALPWWKELLGHFQIPKPMRKEILVAARSEFYDRLDHNLYEADLTKIIDLLNPRTRRGTAKSAARSATNEKLATAIIGYVSRAAGNISPSQKKSAMRGEIPAPPAPQEKAPEIKPKVKKWKRKPDNATIEKAMGIAKRALSARGPRLSRKQRRAALEELDNMGFRIDWDVDPPILRLKR